MGIQTTITVTCDYPECKNGLNGNRATVSWHKEAVESGQVPAPGETKYLVIFNQGTNRFSFCGQLHAAQYFLPPGFSIERNKVVPIPAGIGAVSLTQPDGHVESPENGQCTCMHPPESHNQYGCTELLSELPGDFCRCEYEGPEIA